MLRITRVLLPVGLVAVILAGCIFDPKTTDPPVAPPAYKALTSPESLLVNLQESYKRREIKYYAELLAPEFRFYFQPVDADAIGAEYWNADQDSSGTYALFRTNEVSAITIELIYGPPEVPTEVGFDPDVRKIRINQVKLEVDQTNGTTLLVTDLQDMFFRPGREAAGEDTTRWFLLEWRDIPPAGAPRIAPLSAGTDTGPMQMVSWGALRSKFSGEN